MKTEWGVRNEEAGVRSLLLAFRHFTLQPLAYHLPQQQEEGQKVKKQDLTLGPPEAISAREELLAKYPRSDSAPEAIYIRGVSRYKSTHDAKPLKEAYERLQQEYPTSEWTERASPYRLL